MTNPTGGPRSGSRWTQMAPWTGVAFVACFIGSIVVSSPPGETASNAAWIANYTGQTAQIRHLATGLLLVASGLCLMTFLTYLWRLAAGQRGVSPLPVVAAGVAAACMGVGGVLMASESGMLLSSAPMPNPDLLRFTNDIGFAMVAIPGMCAAALAVASISVQAHAAGLFGRRLLTFGIVVAVLLLAAFAFLPIVGLLLWLLIVSVGLIRGRVAVPGFEPVMGDA